MKEITLDQFARFVADYAKRIGFTLVDKGQALEMHAAALALDVAGVVKRRTFLESMATTIGTVIYIPAEWPIEHKLRVLVHEATHVLQYAPRDKASTLERTVTASMHALMNARFPSLVRDLPLTQTRISVSGLAFAWLYLVEPEERARFEAEAYASGMEFARMRTGTTPALDDVGESLCCAYALDAAEQSFARTILRSRRVEVLEGVYRSTAAKEARDVLRGIDPDLLATDEVPA